MATNSPGMQPPRPPPPSARDTAKESAGRPLRRASNRPPAKSVFRSAQSSDRHAVDASLWESSPTRAPTPSPQTAPVNTRELRDELVRALMPELRTLVEHLVTLATDRSLAPVLERQRELQASLGRSGASGSSVDVDAAVARSLAPLLERQRQLEAALAELQRNPAGAKSSIGAAQHFAEPFVSSESVPIDTQAWVTAPHAPRAEPAIPRALRTPENSAAIGNVAFDTTPWADIPSELNGSRRKRIVLWLLVLGVLALLGTAVGLSVMSNAAAQL